MKYLFLLLFTTIALAQTSGSVTYNFNYQMDLDGLKSQESKDFATNILSAANQLEFQLTFNKQQSHFIQNTKLNFESEKDKKLSAVARALQASNETHTDFETSRQIITMSDGTLIEEKLDKQDWQIGTDSKMIGAYLCYKATLTIPFINRYGESKTKEVVCWFAPSLPYSFGPKSYYGLPGLILELTESQKTCVASKIEFSDTAVKINLPKGKTVSRGAYEKMLESSMGAVILSKKREKEKETK